MPQRFFTRGGYEADETKPSGYQERMRRQAIAARQVSGTSIDDAMERYVKEPARQSARNTAARAQRGYGSKPVTPST